MKLTKIGFILASCLTLFGCATGKHASESGPKLLRITAQVDGSGRFIFTPESLLYQHRTWGHPVEVTFDGAHWSKLDQSPSGWVALGSRLDLRKATIVQRKGRDTIALERTTAGFDLYLSDAPNGAADYEVTLSVPWKK